MPFRQRSMKSDFRPSLLLLDLVLVGALFGCATDDAATPDASAPETPSASIVVTRSSPDKLAEIDEILAGRVPPAFPEPVAPAAGPVREGESVATPFYPRLMGAQSEAREEESIEIPFYYEWDKPTPVKDRLEALSRVPGTLTRTDGVQRFHVKPNSDGTRVDFTVFFKEREDFGFTNAVRALYESLDEVPVPDGARLRVPFLMKGVKTPGMTSGERPQGKPETPAEPAGDGPEEEEASPSEPEPEAAPARPAAAPEIPWRTETYSLVARSMDLRQVFETFGVAEGVSTILSPQVTGALSGEFVDVPCGEFLDRLASLHNLSWYWDGAALWVYGAGETQTFLQDLRYMKAGEVRDMLAELGVEDPRFPIKTASDDELIMVSGPPRYVTLVAEMIQRADALREKRTFTELETRIFPLENTWAEDVSFSAGSPETSGSIRGVASMLKEIVGKIAAPGTREAGSTNAPVTIQPLITSENRLNAVIVTDVGVRMPLYERLIRELDVPQKLVEVSVTVLEMARDNALDWQLSLSTTLSHGRTSGGIGQNAGNQFGADEISGRGLAGALTRLGSHFDVEASVTALRDKRLARNVSRTSILTVNNLAAEISDTQSYHARVVGAEVAELASVTAGTSLKIKPRIMRLAGSGAPTRLWLTLSLSDGGFETVTVDSMPMTRSTSLDTQTSVYEGETVLLAGYLRDIDEEADWGIPWLRDIPLIGWIFGGYSTKTETVQRLFLITPYVVDPDVEDLARMQAARLRDLSETADLREDADEEAEIRELRELEREARGERRREELEERLRVRREELDREREARKLERNSSR